MRKLPLTVCAVGVAAILALVAAGCGPTNSFSYASMTLQPYTISEAQGEVVNGILYQFGGFDSTKTCCTPTNRAYKYTPSTNTWSSIASLPAHSGLPNGGLTHAGMTTDGTNIFFAGGYTSNSAGTGQIFGTKKVWRYNVASNNYTSLPDLPVERAAGQLEYLNGQLHYFGGTNLARTTDVGEHYVLAAGATVWTTKASLPNARHHMGSAVLGGLIYAVGGQHDHDGDLETQNDVHSYDPGTNTWTARADLPTARGHISNATFVLQGRIITAGGEKTHGTTSRDVYAYTPGVGWATLSSLPSAKASGVADAFDSDSWLYTGGNFQKSGWEVNPA